MIEIAQGTPGSGKSAVAVARAILHLKKGGVVAANFSLVDGWASNVANHSILSKFSPSHAVEQAQSLYKRFYRVDSLSAIKKINPVSEAVGLYRDKGGYSEGSGLLILDEAQLIFNSRKWDKNFDWIEFFTQHRKLGWHVILIAHTIEMIDSQIRPLAEYESRFRNLQKVKVPVLGCGLSPFPLFVVIKRYAGLGAGASTIASREVFPLPLWAARLYDSLLVFAADAWGKDTEPRHCGAAPPALRVGGVATFCPGPLRRSALLGPHWDSYVQTLPGVSGKDSIAVA
jgi:zona occludens toxin